MPAEFPCPFCGVPFDARGLALGVTDWYAAMHLHISPCTNCGEPVEFRARTGAIEPGYTYWAGSMHFEGMAELPLPGLRPGERAGTLELDGVPIYSPPS